MTDHTPTNEGRKKSEEAIGLLMGFAERTGLTPGNSPQRYLWTDAFAVCNFLGLAQVTGEDRYSALALRLVDQVHHGLGRHRRDDNRIGWISGLAEAEGAAHPTRGGLRIGKKLPERGPNESLDQRLEWDRDGQYFHYLTKWMHALDQVARATGRPGYNLWARELAETAYRAFTYRPVLVGPRRMVWKMSIDLARPLVSSMGQHDPLDGYITLLQLRATAAGLPQSAGGPQLEAESKELEAMIKEGEWATADPLGIGGLLTEAHRVEQLRRQGASFQEGLLETLLSAAIEGLRHYVRSGDLHLRAEYRLAFRELGLAIGLRAAERMRQTAEDEPKQLTPRVVEHLQTLKHYQSLADELESYWREPAHRRAGTWLEHRDINEVMLATSLQPRGFLVLAPPR